MATLRLRLVFAMLALVLASMTYGEDASMRVYAIGGKSMQNWHGQATIESVNIEWYKPYRGWGDFALVLSPYKVSQPRSWFGDKYGDGEESVRAGSAALLYRRRFRTDEPVQTFVEISSGPMWASRRIPAATSRFNFISQGGFGFVFFPERRASLVLGYRLAHISNAGYAPRNPGLNINSLMIGTQFR
jgi:hypothetical protein